MDIREFRENAHKTVDWIADYFEKIEELPVKSQVEPRDIYNKLPAEPPKNADSYENILNDVDNIIMPGITHWQNPRFHAYFPANSSFPSVLAEMITAGIGAQCMMWQTSPAAAELEEMMMIWLRDLCGIPDTFTGVIQDTASTATLCALLTAREKASNYSINKNGYSVEKYRIYCSYEAHSSIEKAVKIAGFGKDNLVKIKVDQRFSMISSELEYAIMKDINLGFTPLCVVSALGTTGSTAVDPISDISNICNKYKLWHHIDAALAGTAMILPEYRHWMKGIETADSYVFNPHKWMFTNFDCSAYYVKDVEALIKTFEILPEYLKTKEDGVNNYRDWEIPLGRRFRALKLWFVIRSYGVKNLKQTIRTHLSLTKLFVELLENEECYELLAPVDFNTVCFRCNPKYLNEEQLNDLNASILDVVNNSGEMYISHTKLNEKYTLRMVIGQTHVNKVHVQKSFELIDKTAKSLI